MTTAFFIVTTVWAFYLYWQRGHTIDLLREDVLTAKAESKQARHLLDDHRREVQRLRISNAHLIREATTMGADLARSEQMDGYLRSALRRQRDCAAGTMLLGRQTVRAREAV